MRPELNPVLVREAALVAWVTDTESGEVRVVPISCGSTREDRCPPCAERAKRLRMQQCRDGWHRDTGPE
jgi:Replication initiator protein, pSAM2